MIEWLTIALALGITATLVGIFGFVAWKINMSDPLLAGKKEEFNTIVDSDKKKKDKSTNDQTKKKRKDSKKNKRENKDDDDQPQRHVVKFKEPSTQTSEETDNEREESEQELLRSNVVEKSSKARKRRSKQTAASHSSEHLEGILANKDEKSPVTNQPERIPHPKLAHIKPKDEVELAKQHQQTKTQGKSTPKPSTPILSSSTPVPVKKTVPSSNNNTNQKQQLKQEQAEQDQPFTTVGSRHKPVPSSSQQQSKQTNLNSSTTTTITTPVAQQQNKQVNSNSTSTPVVQQQQQQQQQNAAQVSNEPLPQRQFQPSRQQKEPPTQVNGFNQNLSSIKQTATATPPPHHQPVLPARTQPVKLAELVKSLPTSEVVVTELMSALDAFPLSTNELDIIMHKIANKQSVLKQDWTKLQHGQKVDPQAHIGQVLDESARACQEDMTNNAFKHIKDLTDELANEKRRINELINEVQEKDFNIQALRAQLNAFQHPSQQQIQPYQVEVKRLTDENNQLKQRVNQQQQYIQQQQQQQQQLPSMNLLANNNSSNSEPSEVQLRVLSEQVKKLSVDNGNLEKQLKSKEQTVKEFQKEKDDLIRANQQIIQDTQAKLKQFQHNEEKYKQEINELRTLNFNQLNDFKRHVDQLQNENQQLKQVNQTVNNQEREENQQYKLKYEQLQQELQQIENLNVQLTDRNAQIEALKNELEELKSTNDSKQKQFLSELIREDQRNQLPNDQQDLNQWLLAYKQLFESSQRTSQEEITTLKRENDQLHKNMSEIESQLKEIEQTVQSKEELLLAELKNKDVNLENLRHENEQLNTELQLIRTEIDQLQTAQNSAANEIRSLKVQLDEQHLVNTTNPSTATDDLYEFIKQPSPPPSEIDTRAEELNELIRSSKEALENQDSIVQQLDKHLNEMHRGGTGEISDENAVSSVNTPDQSETQS